MAAEPPCGDCRREIGVPAVVGCGDATEVLKDGQLVTVSCAEGEDGHIYEGTLETEETEVTYGELPVLPVKIAMNVGNPQLAFKLQSIPNGGVGLARLEFIINEISVHPNGHSGLSERRSGFEKSDRSVSRGLGQSAYLLRPETGGRRRDDCSGILAETGYCPSFRLQVQ